MAGRQRGAPRAAFASTSGSSGSGSSSIISYSSPLSFSALFRAALFESFSLWNLSHSSASSTSSFTCRIRKVSIRACHKRKASIRHLNLVRRLRRVVEAVAIDLAQRGDRRLPQIRGFEQQRKTGPSQPSRRGEARAARQEGHPLACRLRYASICSASVSSPSAISSPSGRSKFFSLSQPSFFHLRVCGAGHRVLQQSRGSGCVRAGTHGYGRLSVRVGGHQVVAIRLVAQVYRLVLLLILIPLLLPDRELHEHLV